MFSELRRIALITAIAEKLRDQGVPMPFWMRDYEIETVPFERFTPALEVTRSNRRIVSRVYGGVQLSAEDKAVKDFNPRSDLSRLVPKERARILKKVRLAKELEDVTREEMTSVEPLEVRQFEHDGEHYQAVALPGTATQALAPARLREVDLAVPITAGESIELVRGYNSFFNPKGSWGRGWALDLPRLEALKLPVKREADKVTFRTVYELITPLNSIYARFSRIEAVPALNGSRLMVSDQASDFFGLADAEPAFLSGPTRKLIRKDGGTWHFSKAGDLVAIESSGLRTVYERDEHGRIERILGLLGRRPTAVIELTYNTAGALESATGGRHDQAGERLRVRYGYDANGRLASVTSEDGMIGYRYQGAWVTEITYRPAEAVDGADDLVVRSFEYDPRGRLLTETDAVGGAIDYRVTTDKTGSTLTAAAGADNSPTETIRYDPRLRPIEARYADGTVARWRYPTDGGSEMEVGLGDGAAPIRLTESADRRSHALQIGDEYRIDSEYDTAGRLTTLAENGRTLLRQDWTPDGRLKVASNEARAEHYEYDEDGLVARVLLTPPNTEERTDRWQETRLVPEGRPLDVTDYRGQHLSMAYDDRGQLTDMVTHRDDKRYGYQIERDDRGRIQRVVSSWRDQDYAYDPDGRIEALNIKRNGATASAKWSSGLLENVQQFDGGEVSLVYIENGDQAGMLKGITAPNELELAYHYDDEDRLTEVTVGQRTRMLLDYDAKDRLTGWSYRAASH